MKITFYFARHGETLFNRKGRIQGVCDSPLSKTGIEQSQKAAEALKDVCFDKAFISPSGRTQETADIILAGRNTLRETVESLHEFDFGRYEGTRFTSHPDELRRCFDARDFSSADGETKARMEVRVRETMRHILNRCEDGDRALIVSHGMFETFLMDRMLDVDIAALQAIREKEHKDMIPNGSVMVFTYEDGVYKVLSLPEKPEEFVCPAERKHVRFFYVRHGETLFNQWNRMQGRCDSPLTEAGIHQAEQAAAALREVDFTRAYTSPSLRAYRTAEIICAAREIDPVKEKLLMEVDFGDFEGVVADSWSDEIFRRHMTETWEDVGGESPEDVRERVFAALNKAVRESRDGETVLLVSHGTFYLNILRFVFNIDREEYFSSRRREGRQGMPNGGIFTFEYDDGQFRLLELMCAPDEYGAK